MSDNASSQIIVIHMYFNHERLTRLLFQRTWTRPRKRFRTLRKKKYETTTTTVPDYFIVVIVINHCRFVLPGPLIFLSFSPAPAISRAARHIYPWPGSVRNRRRRDLNRPCARHDDRTPVNSRNDDNNNCTRCMTHTRQCCPSDDDVYHATTDRSSA